MENPDEVMDLESQQTLPPDADDNYITGSHAASPEYGVSFPIPQLFFLSL